MFESRDSDGELIGVDASELAPAFDYVTFDEPDNIAFMSAFVGEFLAVQAILPQVLSYVDTMRATIKTST